jgi:serine/threonine protein kinase
MGNVCSNKKTAELKRTQTKDTISNKLISTSYKFTSSKEESSEKVNLDKSEIISKAENYILKGLLGKGSYGEVFLVQSKYDNNYYAMKILNKKQIKKELCEESSKVERILLSMFDSPFIIKLYNSFQSKSKLFLVTEYLNGGTLMYRILKRENITNDDIRLYAAEILLVLEYIHKHDCIYRDLKPDNILIANDGHIKLIDFGLSKIFIEKKNKRANSLCGSYEFMAPEILIYGNYDLSVDWYSYGIILYFLYTGRIPYSIPPDATETMIVEIKRKEITFDKSVFSEEAIDFIKNLTEFKPSKRLGSSSIDDIKNHLYFHGMIFEKVMNKEYTPSYIPSNDGRIKENEEKINHKKGVVMKESYDTNKVEKKEKDYEKLKGRKDTYEGYTFIKKKYSTNTIKANFHNNKYQKCKENEKNEKEKEENDEKMKKDTINDNRSVQNECII